MADPSAQPSDDDQRLRDLQRQYVDLLDDSHAPQGQGVFFQQVQDLISAASDDGPQEDGAGPSTAVFAPRLLVNMNSVRKANPERAQQLLVNAFEELSAFERALREYAASVDATWAKSHAHRPLSVGLWGSFGQHHLTPRTLTSSHLNHVVCIEGIITQASLVKPKVTRSVHYCAATQKSVERTYTDLSSLNAFPSTAAYPTQDEDGNPLQTEFGLSNYKDHQTLTMQELPEKAPTGQLPRSVDVICEYDLVDLCKPGDRVQIVGSYRCLPGKHGGFTSGTFRTVLIANNIILKSQQDNPQIVGEDVLKCKKVCKQTKDIFDVLARSLAPSIHGHDYVKKALLCQLLGGVEKHLPNGSRLRGDINVLLIGDPSVAKSQMLRYVLATANRAVTTTGRGSSGVGLTAAVTTDQETGDRRLEAGAMVLADRGIVCIDEFDKMSDIDRTAIHEVMEQGRVTIAKAGIHARLNARCSVLAAANPVYGRYDPFKTPMENIGLQDSLLSRFDLLFILLDTVDLDSDRKISDHVVRIHRYRSQQEEDGAVTVTTGVNDLHTLQQGAAEPKDTPVWDKFDRTLHSSQRTKLLHKDFIRKYIEIAKNMKPVLTEAACQMIGEEYSRLRSQEWETSEVARTQPITARSLETMIRLATAHAKARMSKTVDKQDAEFALEIVQFAYFKKVMEKDRSKRPHEDDSGEEDDEEAEGGSEQEGEGEEEEQGAAAGAQKPKAKKPRAATAEEPSTSTSSAVAPSKERFDKFMKDLAQIYMSEHVQSKPFDEVMEQMKAENFQEDEVRACIDKMSEMNKLMLAGEILYLI